MSEKAELKRDGIRNSTHDSKPTPKPAMIRPMTMTQKPEVNVWMAPPKAKTSAPMKSVPLRPMMSPMRPAATDVTARYGS